MVHPPSLRTGKVIAHGGRAHGTKDPYVPCHGFATLPDVWEHRPMSGRSRPFLYVATRRREGFGFPALFPSPMGDDLAHILTCDDEQGLGVEQAQPSLRDGMGCRECASYRTHALHLQPVASRGPFPINRVAKSAPPRTPSRLPDTRHGQVQGNQQRLAHTARSLVRLSNTLQSHASEATIWPLLPWSVSRK